MTDTDTSLPPFVPAFSFQQFLAQRAPGIPVSSVEAVLALAAEGATVPFIARYRKERTGNLDEVAIRAILDAREQFDALVKRQAFVHEEIARQGKLTPELAARIAATMDATALEDLYLPYKQKRRTKAQIAREAGLGPLADWLWNVGHGTESCAPGETAAARAAGFVNAEAGFADATAALAGAVDVLVERLSEDAGLRARVRERYFREARLRSRKTDKAGPTSRFENYFAFEETVPSLLEPRNSHRYLAMRRGWMEEELLLTFGGSMAVESPGTADPFMEGLLEMFRNAAVTRREPADVAALLERASRLALRAHVAPSIENEVHDALRSVADAAAIDVFAENVRKLLMAAPYGPKPVLGVDPGVRTGCKLAVVDASGRHVENTVIHPETSSGALAAARTVLDLVRRHAIRALAVGNGTAGRETETFLRETLSKAGLDVPVVMVSESGASVYSASDAAREEFPDLDVTVRGAISIARRLQDPLAELVKVDPKSIGVGQYQHDVSPTALKRSLDAVVDACVHGVGVNVNTASYHLLGRVSGIGPTLARAIVQHRAENGIFRSRASLREVPRFGPAAFQLAAGFLRIPEAENPLDNTGVHPERYEVLERHAARLKVSVASLVGVGVEKVRRADELRREVGTYTFDDIVRELEKPGRDPRDTFVPFSFRADVRELKDLTPGMICPGIVTNVTNFGAFVDIGVHQDGLVHVSQLADRFVKDPREVVSPGDRVQARVLEVRLDRKQIALSLKRERTDTPSERTSGADRARGPAPRMPPQPAKPFNNALAGLDRFRK